MAANHKADDESLAELPELADVIETIDLGLAQYFAAALCGGVFLCEALGMLAFTSILDSLPQAWNLSPWIKSMLQSVLFGGLLVGSLIGGQLADNIGRVQALQICYAGGGLSCLAAGAAGGFWCMAAFCFAFGLCMGIGIPTAVTLVTEISPCRWRNAMNCFSFSFFSLGEILMSLFVMGDDPTLRALHWRSLLQLTAVPSFLLLLLTRYFLQESPFWLAINGRYDDVRQTLDYMRVMNGRECEVRVRHQVKGHEVRKSVWENLCCQLNIVFSSRLRFTTAAMMFLFFVYNFTYVGCMYYSFPQLLAASSNSGTGRNAAEQFLISAVWEIPSLMSCFLLGNMWQRKTNMQIMTSLAALSLTFFFAGSCSSHWEMASMRCTIGFYGCRVLSYALGTVLYLYVAEVFPTEVRSTGVAICATMGRVALVLTPLAYEFTVSIRCPLGFPVFLAVLNVIGFLLAGRLPFETFEAKLQDREVGALQEREAHRSYGTTRSE